MVTTPQHPNEPPEGYIEHAPGFVLPPDREVDCGCDVRLHRPILRDPTGWNNRITACMACGKVSLTESLVEEPHPNDVRCVGNVIEAVAPDVLAWLSAWPRLALGVWRENREIYLPASLRCQSVADLELQERNSLATQRNLSAAQRLLSIGIPDDVPPPGLPEQMKTFAQTQVGLRLGPHTDLETLLSQVSGGGWAMPFAYQHLKNRPDFTHLIVTLLTSPDTTRRDTGITLVQHGRINEPEVVKAVIGLLEQAKLDQDGQRWLYTLLDTLYSIGPAAAAARPILLQIADKIGDKDYYLRKRVEKIHELIK